MAYDLIAKGFRQYNRKTFTTRYNSGKEPYYKTYELADPHDNIPRIIGLCRVTEDPVSLLLRRAHYSYRPWANWIRSLGTTRPVERLGWSTGRIVPIPWELAFGAVRLRTQTLLNASIPILRGHSITGQCAVIRQDKSIVRYNTVGAAVRDKIDTCRAIPRSILSQEPTKHGNIWIDT